MCYTQHTQTRSCVDIFSSALQRRKTEIIQVGIYLDKFSLCFHHE